MTPEKFGEYLDVITEFLIPAFSSVVRYVVAQQVGRLLFAAVLTVATIVIYMSINKARKTIDKEIYDGENAYMTASAAMYIFTAVMTMVITYLVQHAIVIFLAPEFASVLFLINQVK